MSEKPKPDTLGATITAPLKIGRLEAVVRYEKRTDDPFPFASSATRIVSRWAIALDPPPERESQELRDALESELQDHLAAYWPQIDSITELFLPLGCPSFHFWFGKGV